MKGHRAKALMVGLLVWFVGSVALWNWLPYQPRFTLPGTEESVVAGFSSDGRILATKLNKPDLGGSLSYGEENGPIRLWDINTGEEIGSFSTNGKFAHQVELSPDGRFLVINSSSADGLCWLSIIDRSTGQDLAQTDPVSHGLIRVDREHLYLDWGPARCEIWDLSAGRKCLTLNCWPAGISPDGRWFVSMESAYEASLRETQTGIGKLAIQNKGTPLGYFAFSRDSKIVAGDLTTRIKVWDLDTLKELATLERATQPKFSRNGKRMAARCPETGGPTFKLWDTSTWEELARFQVPGPKWDSTTVLAGPGPNDLRAATFRYQRTEMGTIGRWMARFLVFKNLGTPRISNQMRVFDISTGKDLGDFSAKEEIHLSPDGGAFVTSAPWWPANEPKKCISVFDIPPRRAIAQIVLWPLPFALVSGLIFWFRRGLAGRVDYSTRFGWLRWPHLRR